MFVEHKEQGEVTEAPAKTLDEASALLLKAAGVIEDRGWCQNAVETSDGRTCLVGAIHIANHGSMPDKGFDPWTGLSNKAFARMRSAVGIPANWNDAPGRTQAEVVSKLRAVALGL